ncbi:MAG: hypothetical protein ACYDDI_01035 [Candidatus Acidiferrales bacterium]
MKAATPRRPLTPADVAPKVTIKIPQPKMKGTKQVFKTLVLLDASELPAVKAASGK